MSNSSTQDSKRTSEILEGILKRSEEWKSKKKITVGDFTRGLSDRVFGIAIIIFSLINAFIPGVSFVFAIPVFTLAAQMMLGQHEVWIPKRFARAGFRVEIVNKVLRKMIPTLKFLEAFIKPRLTAITSNRGEKFIAFLIILLNLLVIPPIPGLNMVPSLCVCILAVALLENDGFFALVSIGISLVVLAFYYGAIVLVIAGLIHGGSEINMENIHHMFGKAVEKMNTMTPDVDVPGVDMDLKEGN